MSDKILNEFSGSAGTNAGTSGSANPPHYFGPMGQGYGGTNPSAMNHSQEELKKQYNKQQATKAFPHQIDQAHDILSDCYIALSKLNKKMTELKSSSIVDKDKRKVITHVQNRISFIADRIIDLSEKINKLSL